MHIRQSSNHYNNVTEKSLNFYEELKKNIQSIKKKAETQFYELGTYE